MGFPGGILELLDSIGKGVERRIEKNSSSEASKRTPLGRGLPMLRLTGGQEALENDTFH